MVETNADDLDPADWPAFRREAHALLDAMLDDVERVREGPVWRSMPADIRAAFERGAPARPTPLAALRRDVAGLVAPYATGNRHPRFFGWVHGGGSVAGVLGEIAAAALNMNCGGRDHVGLALERQVARWMARAMGLPQSASGLFVTGTSVANLLAVLIARTEALGERVRAAGVGDGGGLRAYASAAAHGCVAQAMDLSGLGTDALRRVPLDRARAIDPDALRAAISADRAAGLRPFLIVGTAGSVDTGAIDDLRALAGIAREAGCWFHVDGAFGALGVLAPGIAPRLMGLERADSIAFDFHKWGQVPYDAGFLLVRDQATQLRTFADANAYLRRDTRGLAAGSPWPCDLGPDLSRGCRALKTWMVLRAHGLPAIGASIERCCALARELAARVEAEPALELVAPVGLNIVCFRMRGDDALNAAIVTRLHESGAAVPSLTTLDGRLVIRCAIVNHRTRSQDVHALIDAVMQAGSSLARLNTSTRA